MNNKWLLLSAGGIAGTILRYAVATWVPGFAGEGFPYGTLAVNLSACLIIGLLSGLSARGTLGPDGRLLLMTGFCGAYSTFSTWILETANLAADAQMLRVMANLFGSVGFGFLFFRLGIYLASVL
jgi:CrcB protein